MPLIDALDNDLKRLLSNVRAEVKRIWSRPLHRYYTDHTVSHSKRLITLLDGMTAGMMETDERLSCTEIYILLAAAYLHDIGMQDEHFAHGDLEAIRDSHHERTAEMIRDWFNKLLRDPSIVHAVALVAKGHRNVDLNDPAYDSFVHGNETVRPRLLAALLRFADELDIDHRRVDMAAMKLMSLSVDSQLHWWKCYYVSGVNIADEYIHISYRFPEGKEFYPDLIIPLVEQKVRDQLAALEPIFRDNAVKVALASSQIRYLPAMKHLPPEVEDSAWRRPDAKDIREVTIRLDQDSKAFDRQAFVQHLARILGVDPTCIRVIYAESGSVVVKLEMPVETADRLWALAVERNPRLIELQIASIVIGDERAISLLKPPVFENREIELETLLQNLTNPAGNHFYLVLAGPQMGKTWFLHEHANRLSARENHTWKVQQVDLRSESLTLRHDAGQVLARLFDDTPPANLDDASYDFAVKVSKSGQPWLCILDSAELLEEATCASLRQLLSQVYEHIRKAGNDSIRLGFVAASRRYHREWRGISPPPRFGLLPLTHFKTDVVESALRNMAQQAGLIFANAWFEENAERLGRVTEGLPALLVQYMLWLQSQNFIGPKRIQDQARFKLLAEPYVRGVLLSADSLLPQGGDRVEERRKLLEMTLLLLSPYRLFTQSHLNHIIAANADFKTALNQLDWKTDNLWEALGQTYLMQPVTDPWRELYPAIRRLLFRYGHPDLSAQAKAHEAAGTFYQSWWDWWQRRPAGKEQSVFLVERLWHQAECLRLLGASDASQTLVEFTEDLCANLILPYEYALVELETYIEERLLDDEEFQETTETLEKGLFNKILDIIKRTSQKRRSSDG